MSAPVTVSAFGVELRKASTPIGLIFEVDGPEVENAERKTTHLLSDWKSKRPTLPQGNELSFKCYMNAANYAQLTADGVAGTVASYSLHFPADDSGTAFASSPTFSAWPSKVKFGGMEEDGTVTIDATLTIVGPITF